MGLVSESRFTPIPQQILNIHINMDKPHSRSLIWLFIISPDLFFSCLLHHFGVLSQNITDACVTQRHVYHLHAWANICTKHVVCGNCVFMCLSVGIMHRRHTTHIVYVTTFNCPELWITITHAVSVHPSVVIFSLLSSFCIFFSVCVSSLLCFISLSLHLCFTVSDWPLLCSFHTQMVSHSWGQHVDIMTCF